MNQPLDHLAAFVLALAWPAWITFFDVPRVRADIASGRPGARVQAYAGTLAEQWILTGLVLAGWVWASRPFAALGLAWPQGSVALAVAAVVAVAGAGFFAVQAHQVRTRPETHPGVRRQLAGLEWFLPHDAREGRWFAAVSFTAGVCEEILFRGFLLAYLGQALPLAVAVIVQGVLFGLAHAYQGPPGALRAGITGTILGALVAATGSLLPAMVLHVAADLAGGRIGRTVLAPSDQATREAVSSR